MHVCVYVPVCMYVCMLSFLACLLIAFMDSSCTYRADWLVDWLTGWLARWLRTAFCTRYVVGTSSLLDVVALAAIAWEVVWIGQNNALYDATAAGLSVFNDSCAALLDSSNAAAAAGTAGEGHLAWAWFGRTCNNNANNNGSTTNSSWAGTESPVVGIGAAWNHETILTFSSQPLRYLTAIQLLKLAYVEMHTSKHTHAHNS